MWPQGLQVGSILSSTVVAAQNRGQNSTYMHGPTQQEMLEFAQLTICCVFASRCPHQVHASSVEQMLALCGRGSSP
jgi:hypothetical protein